MLVLRVLQHVYTITDVVMRTILFIMLLIVLIVFVARGRTNSEETIKVAMLDNFELNFIRPVEVTVVIIRTHFLFLPDSGDKLLLPDSEYALLKTHYSQ